MTRPDPAAMLECFKQHFQAIVRAHGIHGLMGLPAEFDPEAALDLLLANNINPARFVESVTWTGILEQLSAHPQAGKQPGQRLLVAPCSPLFAPILDQLAETFPQICFLDINRAGLTIGGHTIVHPREVHYQDGDLCLILTRNMEACESYERQFGKQHCLNWLADYLQKFRRDLAETTPAFIERLNASHKPVLFVSARPMATLNSTIWRMNEDGFSTYWLGSEDVKEAHQTGYATPKVEDVALTGYNVGSLIDFMVTFASMDKGVALYHYETIYPPSWDFGRVAICYAGCLAMIRTVRDCRGAHSSARLGLYMYDAIKPGVKNYAAGAACGRLYREMLNEAEAIVFSSFTDAFGDFVENAMGRKLPRVHHHRYQTMPRARRPRLTDGYHIAVISVLLEDFWEPSRMGLVPYVRQLIENGLHLHYYVANNSREKVHQFQASLPEQHRHRFHMHTPIHDLDQLANELSQYHAGWSLFNMQVFSEMVAHLDDPFMRDAMDLFTPTTLPSVIWTCAAAGLPVICNRSMTAVVEMLPPGMTLPLTLSELHNLPKILAGLDWAAIDRIPLDDLDISRQIHKLYRFLEDYYVD